MKSVISRLSISASISLRRTFFIFTPFGKTPKLTSEMVANHLRALVAGKVVCDRLISPEPENMRFKYYAICPKCPLKGKCEFEKEMVWRKE